MTGNYCHNNYHCKAGYVVNHIIPVGTFTLGKKSKKRLLVTHQTFRGDLVCGEFDLCSDLMKALSVGYTMVGLPISACKLARFITVVPEQIRDDCGTNTYVD